MKAIEERLAATEARYRQANPRSAALHQLACKHLPDGTTRAVLYYTPFPLTIVGGDGARLRDADGHGYLDLVGEYTSGLYGHSCEPIARVVREVLANGMSFGGISEHEVQLADAIAARFPHCEQVRFCNSGTEANLYALGLARHLTQRPAVVAFSGGYHGGFFSFPGGKPTAMNIPGDVLLSRYNDAEAARALLRQAGETVAAVIVEPVMGSGGCIPAEREFLRTLREESERCGALFIADEVMCSRLAPSGVAAAEGIPVDLTTMGKYLGGGFSFGAVGGARRLMRHLDVREPGAVATSGTFNNNVMSMAAGFVGLTQVYTVDACKRLNAQGDWLREELNSLARRCEVPVLVTGRGGVMNIHFSDRPIRGPEDVGDSAAPIRRLFHFAMLEAGYHTARRGLFSLSLPMTDSDLRGFADACAGFFTAHADVLRAHGANR